MKYDSKKFSTWLTVKEGQLPGLTNLLTLAKSEILIIGAVVFELYEIQGWITPLQRKTGDIDLSVGLVESDDDYNAAKSILIENKYSVDDLYPYRYHSPKKIPGGY